MDALSQVKFVRDGARATLTFARPEVLNAISPTMLLESIRVVEEVAASDARVLIITGEGKSFSAGVDLKIVPALPREQARAFTENARRLIVMLETMPQVVLARVAGHCFTGGLEIALGCDFIIASEDAEFADTHARLGLRPGWGLSQRLPRRIGQQRAREMSFTGRRLTAREAAAMGLILEAVPSVLMDAWIDQFVSQVSMQSDRSISAYKALYRAAETMTLDDGLAYEATPRITDARRRRSSKSDSDDRS